MQMSRTRTDLGKSDTKANWCIRMQGARIGRQARPDDKVEVDRSPSTRELTHLLANRRERLERPKHLCIARPDGSPRGDGHPHHAVPGGKDRMGRLEHGSIEVDLL